MIIGLILLLFFIFLSIGAILWINYDYKNTIKEIEQNHAKRVINIIENGLDKIKEDINRGEE